MLLKKVILILILTLSFSTAAETFKYDKIKAIDGILPQQTKYYEVSSEVGLESPYYVFTIITAHGETYTVVGITQLIKALHEITILEVYRATPQGSKVWEGAKDSVVGVGKGAKQLVLHPGDSGAAIGRSFAKTGRAIGSFTKGLFKKKEKSSSGKDLNEGAGGFLAGDQARIAAYELKLDVYTANPYVRAMLDKIAKKQWAGSVGVSVATYFALPGVSTFTGIAEGALTPGAFVAATEIMIRDNSPLELNRELTKQCMERFNLQKESPTISLLKKFLENPNYTPRQKAYIVLYLSDMSEVHGIDETLRTLGKTNTIDDASILYHQLQLLSATHRFGGMSFATLIAKNNRVAGQLERGDIVAIWPYDYVDATKRMQDELNNIPESKASRSIWMIGDATDAFKQLAKKNNIDAIHADLLHYPVFKQKANNGQIGQEGER